jgi:hypothetical protein
MMLKANCECCAKDLPPEAGDALICSFECTFCVDCASHRLAEGQCPNCGDLVRRAIRPKDWLAKYPASTERVVKPHERCSAAAQMRPASAVRPAAVGAGALSRAD